MIIAIEFKQTSGKHVSEKVYPHEPQFNTVKLGWEGVYMFSLTFSLDPKHKTVGTQNHLGNLVLTRIHSLCFEKKNLYDHDNA